MLDCHRGCDSVNFVKVRLNHEFEESVGIEIPISDAKAADPLVEE